MKRIVGCLLSILFISTFLSAQTTTYQPAVPAPPPQVPVHPVMPPQPHPDPTVPPQPVYIFLYSRVTDHVNIDLSEARLRRLLPMIEKYRKEHPEAHVSATILFSGASSEALAKRNAETGIKDFVLGYKKRGIIEIGYDGTDEPTYLHRPLLHQIEEQPNEQRWLTRASEDEKFLTEGRDPLTGDPKPGTVGGLKAMQQVFGEAAYITGVSVGEDHPYGAAHPNMPGAGVIPTVKPEVGDWEVVPVLRRYNTEAVLSGIPASNPAHLAGFGGSIIEIGRLMSPSLETSPEVFWADNVLRSSESSGHGARVIHGYDGDSGLKDFTANLDRSRLRIIHMELGSEVDYLKPDFSKAPNSPSLSYAYAHPENPSLPPDARLSADEVNAALAKEDAAMQWLLGTFLPANSGSRFVSSTDLKRMAGESTGFSVSVDDLRAALKDELAQWGTDTYPPSYFKVGNRYLSLAEMFQVMTDALAEMNRTGKLPQSVRAVRVYGPLQIAIGHGPNVGDVTVASIAKVCASIAGGLHDDTGYPLPKNTVPSTLTVDGVGMNAAQFLRLMAQALVDPTQDKKLTVRMTYMTAGTTTVFPRTRSLEDTGATWTFKPAPLDSSLSATASK